MCSISGVIQKAIDSRKPAAATAVERMNAALRHRGPDDSGSAELKSESGETVGYFGNTRLAIIDTSPAGHMPMHDPDTGNWITYNGETYNFQQLRREIGDEFGPWRSNTDTEVVLRAYRKVGYRGVWKIAWDVRTRYLGQHQTRTCNRARSIWNQATLLLPRFKC